ncbi:DsbA family oxidoreductase [Cupriavidus basilensis]|uniref:DsbA family oxidoreductase n=1 Tax=Cupriavidus basilensis TaxID=68895 RepID=UPI001ED940D9|nr:DsbA family protein [Cupriavidus basilensis]
MNCSGLPGAVPAPTSSQTLRVDFYLDLICPWCWIGLRNLRSAWASFRQQHPGLALETVWHANALLPQIPAQGVPYQAFYETQTGLLARWSIGNRVQPWRPILCHGKQLPACGSLLGRRLVC